MTLQEKFVADGCVSSNSLSTTDRFSDMLRKEIGFIDAKAIGWKNVAIPMIKKAEDRIKEETIAKLKEAIEKLETFVYLKEFSDWQKISHEGLDKKEVLEILEDIK